ncbi:MAG: family 20 glycosylhydrolase [Candidatus Zhuqueibacterota bacterium]
MKQFVLLTLLPLVILLTARCIGGKNSDTISIIPRPLSVDQTRGEFILQPDTKIYLKNDDLQLRQIGEYLASILNTATGYATTLSPIAEPTEKNAPGIFLSLAQPPLDLGNEGYRLTVRTQRIEILANQPAGLFYGVQTLRQLFPPEIESDAPVVREQWTAPCVTISDAPRFVWRGMHLDVCRHFFPKEFVKRYIDQIAYHKMNTFHWHLTEDQGWRIEIKKYPKLTEVGAWRVDREDRHWNDREPQRPEESATYGGFYTQDEIREIVEYAKSRFVTVVPEIEMPGHAVAALAAYPQYSCTGGPYTVLPGGYWPIVDIYCAGKEETFRFLEDVLSEVIALFPSEFIHIGGDEANKMRWKECPACQARIKSEGLKDENELQSYFVKRIEKFLNDKGKRLIGWDEILEGGLAPNATVMSWRGMQGGIEAANSGHDVVMTPTSYCYFDYYQASRGEPLAIGGFLPLVKVYEFEPVPDDLEKDKVKHILGAQGNIWTEYIPTPAHAEYMAHPRMAALAEVVWTQKNKKDYEDFQQRLSAHFDRLAAMDIHFRVPTPVGTTSQTIVLKPIHVHLKPPVAGSLVRYTVDGSAPTESSPVCSEPIEINESTTLIAQTYLRNGRVSRPDTSRFIRVDPAVNGIHYRYYEGNWDRVMDYSMLRTVREGKVYDIGLSEIEHRPEQFMIVFEGQLEIAADGQYLFYLMSDDGSKLFIDETEVVSNDGVHSLQERRGSIQLTSGLHPFKLLYLQAGANAMLRLSYEGPGLSKQQVPATRYHRATNN